MGDQLTLEEFKNKIKEARAAAENKNIINSDIPAPEGFVETSAAPEVSATPVAAEVKPADEPAVETVEGAVPTPEEVDPVVVDALNAAIETSEEKPAEPEKAPEAAPVEVKPAVNDKLSVQKTKGRVICGRLDEDSDSRMRIMDVSAGALTDICAALDKAVKSGNLKNALKDRVVFSGMMSHSRTGVSLWEEGGMRFGTGTALIVANSDGSKPQAIVVYHDRHIYNGRHALVPITSGSYIIVCYSNPTADHTLVYRVTDILRGDKNERADIGAQLVAYIGGDDAPDFTDAATEAERKLITADASFVKAAYTQATTELSNKPAYVNDYSPTKFDSNDYWNAIADSEYRATLQKFDTLPEAYEAAGKYLSDTLSKFNRAGNAILVTTIDIPEGHDDVVRVFISGALYTPAKVKNGVLISHGTSEGHRGFYARVILKGDDVFYYADRDAQHGVSVSKTLEILKAKTNAEGVRLPMVNVLKRMTII